MDAQETEMPVQQILHDVKAIHRRLGEHVDLGIMDRRSAIYLLQGSIIGVGTASFDLYEIGYGAIAFRQFRVILESLESIDVFENLSDGNRRIKAWFDNRVSFIGSLHQRMKDASNGFTEEQLELISEIGTSGKDLGDQLSKYMHPSFIAVSAGVKNDGSFDYSGKGNGPISNVNQLVMSALIPMVLCLMAAPKTLPIQHDEFELLENHYSLIRNYLA